MRMQTDISNLDHRYTVYNNFCSLCLELLYLHNCLLVGYFVVFAGKENEKDYNHDRRYDILHELNIHEFVKTTLQRVSKSEEMDQQTTPVYNNYDTYR